MPQPLQRMTFTELRPSPGVLEALVVRLDDPALAELFPEGQLVFFVINPDEGTSSDAIEISSKASDPGDEPRSPILRSSSWNSLPSA